MHRARRPTRGESLGRITVLLGVSGRAFCAVTTLPPPEQAAAESREQLAGHQATEQPVSSEHAEPSPGSSSPLPSVSVTRTWRETVSLACGESRHDAPEIVVSRRQPALSSGSPQDGVRAALHRPQRRPQAAAGTAGVPTPGPAGHRGWKAPVEQPNSWMLWC